MKVTRLVAAMLLTGVAAFAISRAATEAAAMNDQTQQNLKTAMHGEAFAYAKYLLYAEQARRSGNTALANLFEQTAKTERLEHLAEEAKLAKLVGDDAANLKEAIAGESYEVDTMYRQFAEQARAAGDTAAAARFEEIRRDEMKHRDSFKAALEKLQPAQK